MLRVAQKKQRRKSCSFLVDAVQNTHPFLFLRFFGSQMLADFRFFVASTTTLFTTTYPKTGLLDASHISLWHIRESMRMFVRESNELTGTSRALKFVVGVGVESRMTGSTKIAGFFVSRRRPRMLCRVLSASVRSHRTPPHPGFRRSSLSRVRNSVVVVVVVVVGVLLLTFFFQPVPLRICFSVRSFVRSPGVLQNCATQVRDTDIGGRLCDLPNTGTNQSA